MTSHSRAGRARNPLRIGHIPYMVLGSLIALVLASSLGCSRDAGPGQPLADRPLLNDGKTVVTPGEDYGLPGWVQRTPFTGYVDHPGVGNPALDDGEKGVWLTWADLEPAHGQYNWQPITDALAAAGAGGYTIQLHILGNVRGGANADRGISVPNAVPGWVFTDLGLTDADVVNLGGQFGLLVIPSWRPAVRDAYNEMIRAFGAAGFPRDSRLGSVYIHALSATRGEEFSLGQDQINLLAQSAGLTPQLLSDWIESRFQAYADAFRGVTAKVAWVGTLSSWRYCDPAYAAVARQLFQDAWSYGFGTRQGGIEHYLDGLSEPAIGASVDAEGHMLVDESIAPIASPRYYGDENEEYGDEWVFRFGPRANEPQRYRFSMLRAMQERLRFLWTSADAEQINPPLSTYARYEFGKSVTDSPDAWAYLFEAPSIPLFSPEAGVVRNFERWLVQRDVPGGMTVPTDQVYRTFNAGSVADYETWKFYDYTARRTDVATGNSSICFALDDRFALAGPIEVKVEIHDTSNATWALEYADPGSGRSSTDRFTGTADSTIKTVSFTINDAVNANALDNGMDFRIACHGPGDVTVRWVRVVRLDQPQ